MVESSIGVQRMVRGAGAVQGRRGAVLGVDEVAWGLGADVGIVGSLRNGQRFEVVFSSFPMRPLWMPVVHTTTNLWMVDVSKGQL